MLPHSAPFQNGEGGSKKQLPLTITANRTLWPASREFQSLQESYPVVHRTWACECSYFYVMVPLGCNEKPSEVLGVKWDLEDR